MKTTRTQYLKMTQARKEARNLSENAKMDNNWDLKFQCDELVIEIDSTYFDKLEATPVKFYIGYRQYFEEVNKIGKSYFKNGTQMTKGRGYRSITEIPAITDKMTKEMIADSYYY